MSNILLNGKYERNANYCPGNIVLNLSNIYESYVYNKIISRNSRVFYQGRAMQAYSFHVRNL